MTLNMMGRSGKIEKREKCEEILSRKRKKSCHDGRKGKKNSNQNRQNYRKKNASHMNTTGVEDIIPSMRKSLYVFSERKEK